MATNLSPEDVISIVRVRISEALTDAQMDCWDDELNLHLDPLSRMQGVLWLARELLGFLDAVELDTGRPHPSRATRSEAEGRQADS